MTDTTTHTTDEQHTTDRRDDDPSEATVTPYQSFEAKAHDVSRGMKPDGQRNVDRVGVRRLRCRVRGKDTHPSRG